MIKAYKILQILIAFLFIFNTGFTQSGTGNSKKITVEDIWQNYTFFPKYPAGLISMNDGETYTQLKNGKIIKYSYKTGDSISTLYDQSTVRISGINKEIETADYTFSRDETKILIFSDEEHIYRYSSVSANYIYDLKTKEFIAIAAGKKQSLADFSPDGKMVAYVRENNLFIFDIETQKEEQITFDGLKNNIINGAPDWVYEEEFGFSKGFFWSPDSREIAFLRFDESKVKEFSMEKVGDLYPESVKFKYPKAGEDNSIVKVHVYHLQSKETNSMDIGNETNIYIPRVKWTQKSGELCITRMNRLQNKLELLLAESATGMSKVIFTETNKYYIDITDNLTFLKDKKHFLWTGESDGYNHIYLYDMKGKLTKQITSGKFDVADLKGLDEKTGTIYYTAAEISPYNRELYSIKIDGSKKTRLSSPGMTTDATFSSNFKYYLCSVSDANTPVQTTINDSKGKLVRLIEDNKTLAELTKEYHFSKKEFFSFTTSDNVLLYGWMIKPVDFDSNKKYPLLMYVYGGPGANTVNNHWEYGDGWYQMLAQKGYIIVSVDNRGTAFRGEEFKKCTYMQLGKFETADQIEAAKYLAKKSFIDSTRIGMWGWSFGGYMSLSCLFKGADVFKMAIAIAPVTNWRFYDNIYTERFMRTPQENPDGYDKNSPVNFVKLFTGKLLVCHGTNDDNVHFQNTLVLAKALNDANKQFDMHIYPNKNHNISGGKTRLQLYNLMTNYILQNL